MNERKSERRSDRRALRLALGMMVLSIAPASARGQAVEPLARYVPSEGLSILVEHNGFDARPEVWKGTSAYKMLNETSLGSMIEDITSQLLDRALKDAQRAPVNGRELVGLLEYLAAKGFVVGFCGTLNPHQPRAAVLVVRDAAKNPVFKRVVASIPPLNAPDAQKLDGPGGRTIWQAAGPPIRWWYEKNDAVFSFAPPGAPDPVVDVLEGKNSSALKNTTREALAKPEGRDLPVGLMFVDFEALPPLPAQAKDLGLDAIKRVEGRLAILEKGIVTSLGIQAPRPRREILALFDQPALGTIRVVTPPGVTDFAVVSVDTIKTGDAIMSLLRQNSPDSADQLTAFIARFQARTGLSLRDDLMGKLGPRMAIFSPSGGTLGSLIGMWFAPPEMGVVAEIKNPKGFATALDALMEVANRELKAAGAMVPPQPGEEVRPGTAFAEFRRLKDPEQGYVLSIPTSVLPTPAGLRPTILVDLGRGVVAFGTSPASARRVLGSLTLEGAGARPSQEPGTVAIGQADQSATLPVILTNLPALVQFLALSANQPNGPNARPAGGPPFRLQLDPDAIPDAQALRSYLFPSKVKLTVDDASIRFSVFQAFPFPAPQLNAGMETPVLIALLLPAVQAAREAARRAQCVNNLKQMGLAMHNYHSTFDIFPAQATVNKQGKPLLSWRVAILPYLDQQALYNKFHLDEPWDSPHNKELIQYMPQVFACPSNPPTPGSGLTPYQVFSGPGALFDKGKSTRLADVTDGLSNTLMVVEGANPVVWTKPDDLPFNLAAEFQPAALFGAGSKHPGGFNALFADGSVRFLKVSINPQVLKALITRASGEVIAADAF